MSTKAKKSIRRRTGSNRRVKKTLSIKKIVLSIVKILLVLIIVVGCALAGVLGGAVYGYVKNAKPIKNEDFDIKALTSFIYDSQGNQIAELTGRENKNRKLVSYDDTPQYLRYAIVAIEDERFYTHFGIDLKRTFDAGIKYILTAGSGEHGGSTITQQVVKNITQWTERSLERKIQEQWNAIQIERRWEKWQILQTYMNIVYMGNNFYGVQSASKAYFKKDVSQLSLAESALLAAIINLPAIYNPFTEDGREKALGRQKLVLSNMLEQEFISQKEYEQASKEKLAFAEPETPDFSLPVQSYFVDDVIDEVKHDLIKEYDMSEENALRIIYNNGLKIETTQDPKIQKIIDEIYTDDKYFYLKNNEAAETGETPQAATVVINPYNGAIVGMYGGYGEKKGSRTLNRATQSERHPGSSFKPIAVYGPGIDLGIITAATVIDDVPIYMNHQEPEVLYPVNYNDEVYDGLTTVRNALKASVNVVAARVWRDWLGYKNSVEYLKKSGIDRSEGVDNNTVSFALGALNDGVNPLLMAAAYVPFANRGIYFEPHTYKRVYDSDGKLLLEKKPEHHTVYQETTAYIMTDILKEIVSGLTSTYPHTGTAYGRIKIQDGKMPVAGKTGTTSDYIDKWFVGYTPYYVSATWYGYDNNIRPIEIEQGEYGQAQILWNAVMDRIHEGLEIKDFKQPAGLVRRTICIYSGKIATNLCKLDQRGNATKEELFIKGTEPRYGDLCDVHVQASVCTASEDIWGRNLLAGIYCPVETVINKVFIQRPEPYMPLNPEDPYPTDWKYELPAGEYCTVHGAPETEPEPSDEENQNSDTGTDTNSILDDWNPAMNDD